MSDASESAIWIKRATRDKSGAVNASYEIASCRKAIEIMETAAGVCSIGPVIVLMRGKGFSYRHIARKCGTSHHTIKNAHSKIIQAVLDKGLRI